MAMYTMELRKAVELVRGDIGLDDYPIHDEAYRETLNSNILNHYHYREIGFETIDMFRFKLKAKMALIMPYYVQMYRSLEIEFDPLNTFKMETESESTSTGTNATESTSSAANSNNTESTSRAVASDFPQMQLSGNKDYATSANDSTGKTGVTGTSSESANVDSIANDTTKAKSTSKGFQGVASDLLVRYRESLLNVDQMVIAELNDLFMQVWDNGDELGDYPYEQYAFIALYGGYFSW